MRGRRIATFLLGSALLAAAAGAQEAPHLLADINRAPHVPFSGEVREEPVGFFNLGDRLFFSTADPSSLDQGILWSTDGTAGGTRQISTTVCPSACTRISALHVQNGVALLGIVSDDGSFTRPGRTDGTPEGTYLLTEGFFTDLGSSSSPRTTAGPGSSPGCCRSRLRAPRPARGRGRCRD